MHYAPYDIEDKIVFETYYKSLCYFAYTLIGDNILAEDFAQEAFIGYFKKKNDISKDAQVIKSYLYSSVRNSVLNWSRHNKVQQKYWDKHTFEELVDLKFDHQIIKAEVLNEINNIINQLPDACQVIFKLSYLEGLSNQEIADQLNISINTVKTQKRRGVKYVQSKLNPEYFLLIQLFFQ